jgi:hypothetical protein
MKIIVVDDLSSALRLYDFNKNIKTVWCLNLKHIISKRKRERERERERETLVGIVVTKKTKPVDCVSLNL